MNNNFQKIVILVSLISLASCSSTKQVAISTTEPSPVDLSNNIRRIGVINAITEETDINYGGVGINGMVAVEDQWLNEKGRDAALAGLVDELEKDQRFETVSLLDSLPDTLRDFAFQDNSVAWNKIGDICDTHGVDAIFALAYYDTETQISFKKTKMMQPNMMREKVEVAGQEITLETLIENGWRIYYPKHQQILDEFTVNEEITSTAKGIDPLEALRSIDNRKDSVLLRGKRAGSSYGLRLQPYKHDIYRDYFVKGTERFETAKDLVAAGDIEGASQLWQLEVANDKSKIKGRACYNMAVSQEIEGDLEMALDWAVKAQEYLQDKSSATYIKELEQRIIRLEVLKSQLVNNDFSG